MNRRAALQLPSRFRSFCAEAAKRSSDRPGYLTKAQILDDPALVNLLKRSDLSSTSPINDPKTKVALLAHLSETCKVPLASNAFLTMSTAESMAIWYSTQLKPSRARPHARNLIRHTLGDGQNTEEFEDRIDLERDTMQEELEGRIPGNVTLDQRTFLKVDDDWVRKRTMPKPQLGQH